MPKGRVKVSRNRMIQTIFLLLLVGTLLFGGIILLKTPRNDRDWSPALARTAEFTKLTPARYDLNNIRRWEYASADDAIQKDWLSASINTQNLKEVWFFIEPFGGNPVFAHSFLSFVFQDENGTSQTLSVSVEARKEAGEPYSAILGALRAYELSYIWSTEKDVLSRIAIKLDHSVYAYKMALEREQAITIFEHFVERTNELAQMPRFYNTFHSNCTNELAKAVNDAFPGALPWHKSWILTGKSGKWLHKLGFMDNPDIPFDQIHARADIQSLVKRYVNNNGFADQWRADFYDSVRVQSE